MTQPILSLFQLQIPLVSAIIRDTVAPEYTLSEVAAHHDASSCWMVIRDKVYDVTSFIGEVYRKITLSH